MPSLNLHWQKRLLISVASFLLVSIILLTSALPAIAADAPTAIDQLQSRFDVTNFELTGKAQLESFKELETAAVAFTAANPDVVEGWIWSGIIRSSYAGAEGGLGALDRAKKSRVDFEQSLTLDAEAMQGSASTSLGMLYYRVPGWPLGFGDDKKAEALLLTGLKLNPDGIQSHFFYAQFLRDEGRKDEAIAHYKTALNAPARPHRAIADAGRRKEIQSALKDLGSE